jgi:hypothetical protein
MTTLTTTLMTMERRVEARRHNEQGRRCVDTAKYVNQPNGMMMTMTTAMMTGQQRQ